MLYDFLKMIETNFWTLWILGWTVAILTLLVRSYYKKRDFLSKLNLITALVFLFLIVALAYGKVQTVLTDYQSSSFIQKLSGAIDFYLLFIPLPLMIIDIKYNDNQPWVHKILKYIMYALALLLIEGLIPYHFGAYSDTAGTCGCDFDPKTTAIHSTI